MRIKNFEGYKKSFLMGVFFTFGTLTSAIVAVTVAATFNSGDTLTAANMNIIKTAIEGIPDWTKSGVDAVFAGGGTAIGTGTMVSGSKLTVNGRVSSSTLGTFCGFTASGYSGSTMGGYSGAKSKCETACSNTNAHMCTAHEISLSFQLGISIVPASSAWFSNPMYILESTPSYHDCSNWLTASTNSRGNVITTGGSLAIGTCNTTYPIACCL